MAQQTRYGVTNTQQLEDLAARLEGIIDSVVYFVGFFFCWYVAVRILRFSFLYTRPSAIGDYRRPAGAWALVTGASDGIGLAFARALASRGFNVVLHGRNESKLNGVKDDLGEAFPRQHFRVLVADAAQSQKTDQQMKTIEAQLANLPGPLTILVNNVGGVPSSIMPSPMASLTDMSTTAIDSLVQLNMLFTVHLTRALLPTLTRNGPGLVINIGSLTSALAMPKLSIYSGVKSFLMTWSSSISRELAMDRVNVEVLGIPVGRVTNAGNLKTPPSFFVPSADIMANACLNRVGCGRLVVIGYWTHALQQAALDLMPEVLFTWVMTKMVEDVEIHRGKSQ